MLPFRRPGWGFPFTHADIQLARKRQGLLSLELELSRKCNLKCIYCYSNAGRELSEELSLEEIKRAIDQAVDLGARKIVVLGGGEPLMYPYIMNVLEYIHTKGAVIELFTNGVFLRRDIARSLYALAVRPVIKMNSLIPEIQDALAGVRGAHQSIFKGLEHLMEAGYPSPEKPLGAQTVICRQNLDELPSMWIWLREKGIIPYFECITSQGRAQRHPELNVSPATLKNLFEGLSSIDAERFGMIWEPKPPIAAFSCDRHEYSCTVTSVGDVTPCPGVDIIVGNLRDAPLSDILQQSCVIKDLRNIRKKIKGGCASCDLRIECYGCRGAAYQATGDYLSPDPICWKNKS